MQKTRITKEDGRYLIFYTFEEEEPSAQQPAVDGDQQSESDDDQSVRDND